MLKVQEYLASNSIEKLIEEFHIIVTKDDTSPLIILNYDQIESSPKNHPVIRECRGLVLDSTDYSLVARSFLRFFNWGEQADEMPLFNFNKFYVNEKVDGSLVIVFNYKGQWFANTRGSFGRNLMQFTDFTWQDAFCQALGINTLQELKLDPAYTYVCEYCSPFNKIVRHYSKPVMYLLTMFKGEQELTQDEVDQVGFLRPERFAFTNIDDILTFLVDKSSVDPTFEGIVKCDDAFRRWKVKSKTYVSLHHMRGNNGENLYNPKYLLPFILAGETDEVTNYFEETKEVIADYKNQVDIHFANMMKVWEAAKDITVQKDFALAIVGKTPFTGFLFEARKKGVNPSLLWRSGEDAILKHLKTPSFVKAKLEAMENQNV